MRQAEMAPSYAPRRDRTFLRAEPRWHLFLPTRRFGISLANALATLTALAAAYCYCALVRLRGDGALSYVEGDGFYFLPSRKQHSFGSVVSQFEPD